MSIEIEANPDAPNRFRNPYFFDLDQNEFPLFTDKNIQLVNAMIAYNSSYNRYSDDDLKQIYRGMFESDEETRRNAIRQVVYVTDHINSTHLTALKDKHQKQVECDSAEVIVNKDKCVLKGGAYLTTEEIIEIKNLRRLLNEPDPKLVRTIALAAQERARREKQCDSEKQCDINKNNFSFATKFCHHASRYSGETDDPGKAKYCIYDKVVGEVLPYYACAYMPAADIEDFCNRNAEKCDGGKITKSRYSSSCFWIAATIKELAASDKYEEYADLYCSVRDGINNWRKDHGSLAKGEISFEEIDSLIWYYFKGARLDKARKLLKGLGGDWGLC